MWTEYVTVFGTTPQRIELINKAAPEFFYHVQKSLENNILLHLCQLTDPPETKAKREVKTNLTIRRLPSLISDQSISERIGELLKKTMNATEFCRDWRNRRIAHRDLPLAMGRDAKPLEIASRAKIKTAIHSIADVLNEVSSHYMGGRRYIFQPQNEGNGGRALLQIIDSGLRHNAARLARLKDGTYTEEDLQHPEI